ncbi:MAG: hypothetical protein J6U28_08630 [Bacteroidales bacterium]|nr:hypothetical protein [Bacteroidales bacterium]
MAIMEVDSEFIVKLIELTKELSEKSDHALEKANRMHNKDLNDHASGKCTTMQLVETQNAIAEARVYDEAGKALSRVINDELRKHTTEEGS